MGYELDIGGVRILGSSGATQFYYGSVVDCDENDFALTRGEVMPRREVVIHAGKGGRGGDFLWNDYLLYVVSRRTLGVLKRNEFSGYSTYPVSVMRAGKRIRDYRGVSILGRAGPIDQARSGVKRFPRKDGTQGGVRAIDGLRFDPANWDGSDIFLLDEFNGLLMVEKVWKSFENAGLTNFKARPLAEFRFGQPRVKPRS